MPPLTRRSKPNPETTDTSEQSKPSSYLDGDIPKSKRWSEVSGSANADRRYRWETRDPEVAYSFITICRPAFWYRDEDEEDELEVEDEDEDEILGEESNCDGGKTCCCGKPATERPDYPWVISKAGHIKYHTQTAFALLRSPDTFGMYIYNDFEAYGAIEIVENLFQDYHEALLQKNWKEQWIICEAMALMWAGDTVSLMYMADDSERVAAVLSLVTRMVLNTLSTFESMNLLKADPEVKSLGLVMALFIVSFKMWKDICEHYSEPKKKYKAYKFDSYLVAYAKKFDIKLKGPPGIDRAVAEATDDKIKLQSCSLKDPWEWKKYLGEYKKEYGYYPYIIAIDPKRIGGDGHDITAWDSDERARHSFTNKDPLTKKEREKLKKGYCLDIE